MDNLLAHPPVGGPGGDPETTSQWSAPRVHFHFYSLTHPLSYLAGIRNRSLRQYNSELIPTISESRINTSYRILYIEPDLLQHLIASQMTIDIVIWLKQVKVDEEQGENIAEARTPGDLLINALMEITMVQQAGQLIRIRPLLGASIVL